jgi:hypothetical protein
MRKARFVIPVIALGGLAIGSFVLLRRRRNQSAWAPNGCDGPFLYLDNKIWGFARAGSLLVGLGDGVLHLLKVRSASFLTERFEAETLC